MYIFVNLLFYFKKLIINISIFKIHYQNLHLHPLNITQNYLQLLLQQNQSYLYLNHS